MPETAPACGRFEQLAAIADTPAIFVTASAAHGYIDRDSASTHVKAASDHCALKAGNVLLFHRNQQVQGVMQ